MCPLSLVWLEGGPANRRSTAGQSKTLSETTMRILFFRLIVAPGFLIVLLFSACASNNGSLQSRIESKLDNPESDNVQIGTAHYNPYAKDFEEPWPFGAYSN
jgi:hypothetical protein